MAIVRVALPVPVEELFDYWVPDGLTADRGSVVRVRLARKAMHGVVVEVVATSEVETGRLSPIEEIVAYIPPLPEDLMHLASFVAQYYQEPLGLACALLLPPLGKKQPRHEATSAATSTDRFHIELNSDQRYAAGTVQGAPGEFSVALLQGVTGSGKTEVYLAAAARVIERGAQVLMLVPEINLTPQLEQRIAATLPGVRRALLHSKLAAGERRRNWLAAARGDASLIVATRLGVFAPLPRLGLIVVDEEQDSSFKQQDGVRYHARDVAIYRGRLRSVPVVLGSATPSLESHLHAMRGRYRALSLPQRARMSARLPQVHLVPMRGAERLEGIGGALREALRARLTRGEQSLVFVNRRGFAPALLCAACGWKAMCDQCSARLVLHREREVLVCHHCSQKLAVPRACPSCGNQDLLPTGYGTQRLASALAGLFPRARIVRIDADSTARKDAFSRMRDAVAAGEVDILVGTQMLAKGHDFDRVSLVGILGADNALYSGEFRAAERLFAMLEQVAGRAGRGELPGEVIVQTDFPGHPLFQALVAHDYDSFAAGQLAEREAVGLPPFSHLALLVAEATSREALMGFLEEASMCGRALADARHRSCSIFAPVAAALSRKAGMERAQVLAQSQDRQALQAFLPRWREAVAALSPRGTRWSIDVDPLELT